MAEPDGKQIDGNNVNPGKNDGTARKLFGPSSSFVVNPADVGSPNSGDGSATGEPKRRGRKPGSTNKPRTAATAQNSAVDKNSLRDLILFAHTILEQATKIPEFKMETVEADAIATASVNVLRHYDIGQQSQKAMDWIALIGAFGIVYGPRIAAYRIRTVRKPGVVQPIRPSA